MPGACLERLLVVPRGTELGVARRRRFELEVAFTCDVKSPSLDACACRKIGKNYSATPDACLKHLRVVSRGVELEVAVGRRYELKVAEFAPRGASHLA